MNAFGELTVVNDTRLRWDIAAGVPSLLDVDGTSVFTGPAGVTGIETSWQNHCGALLGGSDTQDQTLAAVSAHCETWKWLVWDWLNLLCLSSRLHRGG